MMSNPSPGVLGRVGSPSGIVQRWRQRLRLTLVQQLVVLVLAFSSLSIVAVLAVLSSRYLQEVAELGELNARIVAQQAARAAYVPLVQDDWRSLADVAHAAMEPPGARLVQIRSLDGEILAQARSDGRQGATLEVIEPVMNLGSGRQVGEIMVRVDAGGVRQAQRNLWWLCGLLFLGCLAVVGVVGWWVARRVSAPVRELAAAVDALAVSGEPRAVEPGSGEIGRLQRGFNRAALALAHQRRSLEAQVRQATAALEQKNAELHAANQAKVRLLAAASHDLRQPLHAMAWFTEALQHDETDPVRAEHATRVRECVDSLERLFSGLLDLAQLDAGAIELSCRPFALDDLFVEVSRNFRPQAEQQALRLVVRQTPLWVDTDYVMLSRILNNLVSNALRYTPTGGVLVGARRRGDRVSIDVVDTGVGIPETHHERVFEEFYQVDASAVRTERGLGLGLSTVKRVSGLLGAQVSLSSRPGQGTRVSVTLPWCAPPPVAVPAMARGRADPVLPGLAGMRVLVIDDEAVILEGLGLVLRQCGATVMTALNRCEALALTAAPAPVPDVVICDLLLGGGDNGLALLRTLCRQPHWQARQPGLLLVTGETSADRLREIAAARIPMLHKPVAPALLRRCIEEVAARAAEDAAARRAYST